MQQPLAPLPTLRNLDVKATPFGIVASPRARATSWLIEAAVWLVGGCITGAMIAFGPAGWVQILGAVLLVPIGVRALIRTIRFVTSRTLRQLSIAWRAPVPNLAGPFAQIPMGAIVSFDFVTDRGDRYFCAYDAGGAATHLVTIDPADEPDYRALVSWMIAQGFLRSLRA